MNDDDFPLRRKDPNGAENPGAESNRLPPLGTALGPLYRVVEVRLDGDGRISRVGRIWHSDLERVRQFGHALAARTSGAKVEVADASGRVIETVARSDGPPVAWGQWQAVTLPPLVRRASGRATKTSVQPTPKGPPTMVPPILPPVLQQPEELPPENEVERTNSLLPLTGR
jgi:hypothetical protein